MKNTNMLIGVCALLAGLSGQALAQAAYPNQPIRFVVTTAAGGGRRDEADRTHRIRRCFSSADRLRDRKQRQCRCACSVDSVHQDLISSDICKTVECRDTIISIELRARLFDQRRPARDIGFQKRGEFCRRAANDFRALARDAVFDLRLREYSDDIAVQSIDDFR